MRVLIISCFFPPGDRIADLRAGKWAKYLRLMGVDVAVLTAIPDPRKPPLTPLEIPEELVVRTPMFRLSRTKQEEARRPASSEPDTQSHASLITRMGRAVKKCLYLNDVRMPDNSIGWYPYAIRAGRRTMRAEHYDCIVSTSGPVTSHFLAHRLQRNFGCPWIADYRDLWSQNHLTTLPWGWRHADRLMEKRTISNAAVLTTVSEPLANRLRELHDKPVEVITNGYDPDDYAVVSLPPERMRRDCFVLSYMGALYSRRDPAMLFRAVRQLASEHVAHPEIFRIFFYGQDHSFAWRRAMECGVQEYVDINNPVSYYESLALQRASTALLLVEEQSEKAEGVLTGKLFEYMGAERPILAIGHERSAVGNLLQKTNAGIFCSDYHALVQTLRDSITTFKAGRPVLFEGRRTEIEKYSRQSQTEILYQQMLRMKQQ